MKVLFGKSSTEAEERFYRSFHSNGEEKPAKTGYDELSRLRIKPKPHKVASL
jgi:hypothetical protein